MVRHQAIGYDFYIWQDIFFEFFKEKQVVILFEEYLAFVISLVIYVV